MRNSENRVKQRLPTTKERRVLEPGISLRGDWKEEKKRKEGEEAGFTGNFSLWLSHFFLLLPKLYGELRMTGLHEEQTLKLLLARFSISLEHDLG